MNAALYPWNLLWNAWPFKLCDNVGLLVVGIEENKISHQLSTITFGEDVNVPIMVKCFSPFPVLSLLSLCLWVWSSFLTLAPWLLSLHTCPSSLFGTPVCHLVHHPPQPTTLGQSFTHGSSILHARTKLLHFCIVFVGLPACLSVHPSLWDLHLFSSVSGLSSCLPISSSTKPVSQLSCLVFPLPNLHLDFLLLPSQPQLSIPASIPKNK